MKQYTLKRLREEAEITIEDLSEYSGISLETIKKIDEKDINEVPEELTIIHAKLLLNLERMQKAKNTKNYKEQLEKEIFEEAKNYNKLSKNIQRIKLLIFFALSLLMILLMIFSNKNIDKSFNEKMIIENENILNIFSSLTQELKILNLEIEKKESEKREEKIKNQLKLLEEKINKEKISTEKISTEDQTENNLQKSFLGLFLMFITTAISYIIIKFDYLNTSIKTKEKIVEKFSVEALINELDKDFDNNMIKINIYQLNAYNDQTKSQANKSFKIASITSVIGFILLCIGLILVFFEQNNSGYLATGVGLLIEFLSGVIFYLYNKTIIKMGEYHKKIVLTQNIALALKATADFELNKKMEIRGKIIEEILKDINKFLSEK